MHFNLKGQTLIKYVKQIRCYKIILNNIIKLDLLESSNSSFYRADSRYV